VAALDGGGRVNHTIRTFTGKNVDLQLPTRDVIDIRDVAHSLAGINRFTSHTRDRYSVAVHCVIGSYFTLPEFALEFLMHDAHEAYLGDVSSPLKSLLGPEYGKLADHFDAVIGSKFGLRSGDGLDLEIKRVDALMLHCEMRILLSASVDRWHPGSPYKNAEEQRVCHELTRVDFKNGEQLFLNRFHELIAEQYLAQLDIDHRREMTSERLD
jgi:5'-deoxynucleotidase YfbR-like HD superfamily hydrolase